MFLNGSFGFFVLNFYFKENFYMNDKKIKNMMQPEF